MSKAAPELEELVADQLFGLATHLVDAALLQHGVEASRREVDVAVARAAMAVGLDILSGDEMPGEEP